MSEYDFKVLLRSPVYPVLVISDGDLDAAFNVNQLAVCCVTAEPLTGEKQVGIIDASGSEFWFRPDELAVMPAFTTVKQTKKQIIELFNSSLTAELYSLEYPVKLISSRRLDRIIYEICSMIDSVPVDP